MKITQRNTKSRKKRTKPTRNLRADCRESKSRILTTDLDRRLQFKKIWLLEEDLFGGDAELPYLRLGELHLLAGPRSDLEKTIDDVIQDGRVDSLPLQGHEFEI